MPCTTRTTRPSRRADRRRHGDRRREYSGTNSRQHPHGLQQRDGPPGAGDRKQVRARHRLLHPLWRHGRRAGAHRRRVQDEHLPPGEAGQRPGGRERIPQSIIDKPPSAELKPNQFDQDKLPPYDLLDEILHRYVELDQPAGKIIEGGFDPTVVNCVVRMVDYSEYKRKQAAPVLKTTARAFGTGRRMPIAQRYRPLGGV